MPALDFFYDLGSPYSYLAFTQLAGISQRTGATVRLLPVTLGGIRKATGNQFPPSAQLVYMSEDTQRWAKKYGVRMQIPAVFPARGIQALRVCVAAEALGCHADAAGALFSTYWADGEDIGDPAVIARSLTAKGLDASALLAASGTQEIKDGLRRNTDLALSRGVFGVPTLFVGERSFWGNDRLEFVEKELQR